MKDDLRGFAAFVLAGFCLVFLFCIPEEGSHNEFLWLFVTKACAFACGWMSYRLTDLKHEA